MKKYNLIYYWQNFLANQEDVSLKPNAYVIKFCIVNKYSYHYYCNWYSFANVEEINKFFKICSNTFNIYNKGIWQR